MIAPRISRTSAALAAVALSLLALSGCTGAGGGVAPECSDEIKTALTESTSITVTEEFPVPELLAGGDGIYCWTAVSYNGIDGGFVYFEGAQTQDSLAARLVSAGFTLTDASLNLYERDAVTAQVNLGNEPLTAEDHVADELIGKVISAIVVSAG